MTNHQTSTLSPTRITCLLVHSQQTYSFFNVPKSRTSVLMVDNRKKIYFWI